MFLSCFVVCQEIDNLPKCRYLTVLVSLSVRPRRTVVVHSGHSLNFLNLIIQYFSQLVKNYLSLKNLSLKILSFLAPQPL